MTFEFGFEGRKKNSGEREQHEYGDLRQNKLVKGMCLGSVQFSSVAQSCPTLWDPWTAACQASLSITNSWSLLKFMSIKLVMPSNHLILCCSLFLPSIFPSIRVFSDESVLHIRWPKHGSFSFSISSSNEYSGLIFFRIDWFDLFAVQGTLRSLLQHHSSNASFFSINFLYGPTLTSIHDYWKNHSFNYTDLFGKVMSLLFNMLSRIDETYQRNR